MHTSRFSQPSNNLRSFSRNKLCNLLPPSSFRPLNPRLPSPLSVRHRNCSSEAASVSSNFISSVGSPPLSVHLSHWNLYHRHILLLNVVTCAAAVSTTWLFFSAIPTLLALKRAAESLEKLLDVTREELPSTMASVRLSGMEISDLTTELSDLGQDFTQGVRSSTRAIRSAQERLSRLTNMAPSVSIQELTPVETRATGPLLARTARSMREGVVKGRAILQMLFLVSRFSCMAFGFFTSRSKS